MKLLCSFVIGISWDSDWFFWCDGCKFIYFFGNGSTEQNGL